MTDRSGEARWGPVGRKGVILAAILLIGLVLRLAAAARHPLVFDEAFTASAGRLPVGRLLAYLRRRDSHPPLDYLLRAPIARRTGAAWLIRLPSVAASVAALGVATVWFRRFGRAGAWAALAAAIGSFPLLYASQARMYAAMTLVGVAVAALALRWLETPRTATAAAAAGVLLAGLFLHSSALLVALGLVLLPGLRRDRPAWVWRGCVAAAALVWAAAWGTAFVDQARGSHASWIPLTSPGGLVRTVNELVDFTPALAVIVVAGVVAGLVLVCRRDRTLGRVVLVTVVVPIALVAVFGIRAHLLLSRTIAFAWWAPFLALGALVDVAWSRLRLLGAVAVCAVMLIVASSSWQLLTEPDDGGQRATRVLVERVQPGDVAAVYPGWLFVLTRWYIAATGPGARPVPPARSVAVDRIAYLGDHLGLRAGSDAVLVGDGQATGRAWLLWPTSYPDPGAGLAACPGSTDYRAGVWALTCRMLPSSPG